jgi:hypothetical protein
MARESKRKRDERRFGRPERLADRILADGLQPTFDPEAHPLSTEQWSSVSRMLLKLIESSIVVRIDNVIDYVDAWADREVDLSKEIPNCTPSYQAMFFEDRERAGVHRGVLVVGGAVAEAFISRMPLPSCFPAERHGSLCLFSFCGIDGSVAGPGGTNVVAMHADGSPMFPTVEAVTFGDFMPPQRREAIHSLVREDMVVALMTMAFMHCKNVVVSPVQSDERMSRERARAGLRPFLRYHTININPMKEVLRGEGGIESVGLSRALHICRGHFATLTRNNKGNKLDEPVTYFRSAHVRGSAKAGVVVSDYNVSAPNIGGGKHAG